MGSDRVRAEKKSSSSLIPGSKPKKFSFLQPRYQDQVEAETDSVQENKQQNTWSQANPTPPFLGHSFGRVSVLPLQAKLTIGQPGDKYEQEADRVADQVMRMPEPKIQRVCPECEEELQRQPMEEEEEEEETLQTKPLAKQITPLVQRQAEPMEEEEEEETLQTQTALGQLPSVSSNLQNRITALKGGGQPLPQSERAFFEPRFGTNFSQVRIHANSQASEAAHKVNARAFTQGKDMVFGAGQYAPGSFEGRRLLAHELTHVVQQAHDQTRPMLMRSPLFTSTLQICHQYLRSRRFRVTEGGLRVTINAHWGGEETDSPPPPVCRQDRSFSVELRDVGLILDSPWGTCDFPAGAPVSRIWTNLPAREYYLGINTPDTGPYCCLRGSIEVAQERGLTGQSCTQPPPGPLEILHAALDAAGMFPGLGIVPDTVNAGIYSIQGDWLNAGISAAAMVPIFGQGATVTRYGLRVTGEAVERVGREGIEAGIRGARSVRIGTRFIDSVLASARRSVGQQSQALRKLQRRQGDPSGLGLFNNVPLNEEAAQGIVRQILSNAVTQRFGRLRSSAFAGKRGIAIFDDAGRGVLVRQSDGHFITFLEEPRGLGNIFR